MKMEKLNLLYYLKKRQFNNIKFPCDAQITLYNDGKLKSSYLPMNWKVYDKEYKFETTLYFDKRWKYYRLSRNYILII